MKLDPSFMQAIKERIEISEQTKPLLSELGIDAVLPCETCSGEAATIVVDLNEIEPSRVFDGMLWRSWECHSVHYLCDSHGRSGKHYMRDGTVEQN